MYHIHTKDVFTLYNILVFTLWWYYVIKLHLAHSSLVTNLPFTETRTSTPPGHSIPHPISSELEGPNSTVETASTTVLGRENIALKAFIKCFNELHTAILPHTKWLAEKVSAQRIISKEFLILGTVSKPSQNASLLLSNIQSAISKDYRCLRRFVRVLKKQESLKSVAESLITSYRKLNLDHQAVLTSQLSLILKGYSSEECESYSFILWECAPKVVDKVYSLCNIGSRITCCILPREIFFLQEQSNIVTEASMLTSPCKFYTELQMVTIFHKR